MANIFTLENIEDFSEKLNIDELYEKKRQHDLNKLSLFNKILNRIHVRIRTTSRQRLEEQFCWFVVPEIIIGVPKYDQGACIAYLLDRLKDNGFNVRYIHPNTLFISWMHWVPSYVRTELKKKTGIVVNEYGVKQIENVNTESDNSEIKLVEPLDPNNYMLNLKEPGSIQTTKQQNKNFKPINSYKPSGNLVYDDDLLNKIEGKFN
jgi:hypothetical protein